MKPLHPVPDSKTNLYSTHRKLKMKVLGVMLAVILIASGTFSVSVSAQSCKACNCQFSNVEVLNDIVEAQVNRILAKEPSK